MQGEDINSINRAISGYVRAFETLDPEKVVDFYAPTCIFIRPERATAATDRDSQLKIADFLIEHAKSGDYHRTEIEGLKVTVRGDRLAMATGTFIRFGSMGNEIGRFGATYILKKDDEGQWLIVVAMAFPPTE